MPVKCAVLNCKSNVLKRHNKISFFKFPMDIPKLLEKWIVATNRNNWTPLPSSRICHLHFNNNDFSNSAHKRVRLKPDAIPIQHFINIHDTDMYINSNTENTSNKYDTGITQNGSSQIDLVQQDQLHKRKAIDRLESTNIKCRKIENDNERLKATIQSLKESYEKQFNTQANMFRTLMEKENNKFREKLSIEKRKFTLLKERHNRMEATIEVLIEELLLLLRKSGRVNEEAYDIISSGLSGIS